MSQGNRSRKRKRRRQPLPDAAYHVGQRLELSLTFVRHASSASLSGTKPYGKQSDKKKVAGGGVLAEVTTTSLGVQGPPPSWLPRDWLWGLILILAVILIYTPLWRAGFIWDDDAVLTANPCIVGPLGLREIWTTSAADICPLVLTTFWVEHALWGLAPLPYHLVNVLLHGACAILLWRVLGSLRVQGAWLGAALWALHPVAVESVAWITEMKNTESGVFFLLSILFFVRWLRAKELDGRTGGVWNYALTLLFAALAMASKSSTVILPVIFCLCAWWMEGRWHWRNVARVVPIFLMSIAASALSIWTQMLHLPAVTDPQWVRTWPQRLATAGDVVWFYLGKLAMARSIDHHLSALADRCRAVVFVFAAAGSDRHFIYFLVQTRALVSRLFFCFRLFDGGLAASTWIDGHLYFSLFLGL